MRTFDLLTPQDAIARLNQALADTGAALPFETIAAAAARDRVLARDVVAPSPLPEFRRSTVDGYAIQASYAGGALRVIGEVAMGELTALRVGPGEAALIHTGGHVPEGADAVAMLENTTLDERPAAEAGQRAPSPIIRLTKQLSPGDNTIQPGEDVQTGEAVMRGGTRLREQEIGGLLSFGFTRAEVVRRPRVALIASGDEVVPPEAASRPGQVRNINTPMLSALVARNGGVALDYGILPDRREAFEAAAARAMREADVVIFMAGSSVSERDFTPDVVNGMGRPGILAHGIAFRPGKPTLFAVCDGKPVFGLPGNPVSALVTASLFVAPVLWRLQGALNPPQPTVVSAVLSHDVRSPRDLEHWFPVRLERLGIGDWRSGDDPNLQSPIPNLSALPIATKSNLIFSLARADGLVCAPIGVDRLAAGAIVGARLLE
jgi:molybdopterin molybdotransferase